MPSTPFSTAKYASSTVSIPLRIIGSVVVLQQFDPNIYLICSTQYDKKNLIVKSNTPKCQDKESSQTVMCRYRLSHFTSSQETDASNNAVTYSLRPEPVSAEFIRFDKSPWKFANLKQRIYCLSYIINCI